MLSKTELNWFKTLKNDWYQFKVERNMSKYQGKDSPNWISMLDREKMVDNLIGYCDTLLKELR